MYMYDIDIRTGSGVMGWKGVGLPAVDDVDGTFVGGEPFAGVVPADIHRAVRCSMPLVSRDRVT